MSHAARTQRFKVTNALAVTVHPQNRGVFLIDVDEAEGQDSKMEFNESFDLKEMVDQVEKELEREE